MKRLCLSCGLYVISRKYGLCRHCYKNPETRDEYKCRTSPKEEEADPEPPAPARARGDKYYRCLWCLKWKCDKPLWRCADCHVEYLRMAEGMPYELDRGYDPIRRG